MGCITHTEIDRFDVTSAFHRQYLLPLRMYGCVFGAPDALRMDDPLFSVKRIAIAAHGAQGIVANRHHKC